jgi:hypothetical protein
MATFHVILHTVAGGALVDNRHFASIPFSQIMDVSVAFDTVEAALRMMHTSLVFLGFPLMAKIAIDLRRYVDFFRMLFKIDDIDMTAAARIGAMDGVCIFAPVYGTPVAFQAIRCKKGPLHVDVDGHRSEFSKRR